jgi:hypothetical protein
MQKIIANTFYVVGVLATIAIAANLIFSFDLFDYIRSPRDYEDCAAVAAKKAETNRALETLLSVCDTRFPVRRKIGGGYSFYDPISETSIDVSGPNITSSDYAKIQAARRKHDAWLSALETARQQQKAIDAAEKEASRRRNEDALKAVRLVSSKLSCRFGCAGLSGVVTVANDSRYKISAVEFGMIPTALIRNPWTVMARKCGPPS